jgi:transglutaminase-like putative cysteine protease
VRYLIHQTTTYSYGEPAPFARHLVRMQPASRRLQKVQRSELLIDPMPDEQWSDVDFFGNSVVHFAIGRPHGRLAIDSRSEVSLEPRELTDPRSTPTVATIRAAAAQSPRTDGRGPAHHLFPSRLVPLDPEIRAYAAASVRGNRSVLEAARELALRIHADFAYDPVATDVSTPVSRVLAERRGVCQDFAQLMISGLRGLGLPAAYVSGYLRTVPAPGAPRLTGADAMHAWVAVWCGEGIGWRGLDPTNAVETSTDHVEVAFGRDYSDVSPLDGVIVSAGRQSFTVAVDVAPA